MKPYKTRGDEVTEHDNCGICKLKQENDHLKQENERLERACRTLGEIVDRNAEDVCRIAGVPMPANGDADFMLAWERLAEMGAAREARGAA